MSKNRIVSLAVLVTCLLTLLSTPPARGEDRIVSDSWYAIYMGGVKIGWSQEKEMERTAGGRALFVTVANSKMIIARMGTEIRITQSSEVVEDEEGCLVSFLSRQKKSAMAQETRGEVKDGKLVLSMKVGGMEQPERVVDLGSKCLPPNALRKLMKKKGLEKGTHYKAQIFSTEAPDRPMDLVVTVKGPEEVDILGAKRTLIRVDTVAQVMGQKMVTKSWIDSEWKAWKTNTMGLIETVRLPRDLAMKAGEVKEVFLQTIIPPDKFIEDARERRRLVLRLELEDDEAFETFPTGHRQTIREKGDGFIEVEIKAADVDSGENMPVSGEGLEPFLASTAFLRGDDPRISKMARDTVGAEKDSLLAARMLEKKVYEAIKKKNFGVGFATASEVAKNLEGDCSEHAVLLAALCRAVGIPSRVVGGLVYADLLVAKNHEGKGGFGFHLWTEVYVGSWVALDATLGDGFVDATHITLARSALESESSIFEILPIGHYMGKLKIKVIEK